jgi:hypothetical protein
MIHLMEDVILFLNLSKGRDFYEWLTKNVGTGRTQNYMVQATTSLVVFGCNNFILDLTFDQLFVIEW